MEISSSENEQQSSSDSEVPMIDHSLQPTKIVQSYNKQIHKKRTNEQVPTCGSTDEESKSNDTDNDQTIKKRRLDGTPSRQSPDLSRRSPDLYNRQSQYETSRIQSQSPQPFIQSTPLSSPQSTPQRSNRLSRRSQDLSSDNNIDVMEEDEIIEDDSIRMTLSEFKTHHKQKLASGSIYNRLRRYW